MSWFVYKTSENIVQFTSFNSFYFLIKFHSFCQFLHAMATNVSMRRIITRTKKIGIKHIKHVKNIYTRWLASIYSSLQIRRLKKPEKKFNLFTQFLFNFFLDCCWIDLLLFDWKIFMRFRFFSGFIDPEQLVLFDGWMAVMQSI